MEDHEERYVYGKKKIQFIIFFKNSNTSMNRVTEKIQLNRRPLLATN